MKRFKVCLAVLLIAIMMGGSAWAFNAADHVKVAPNGRGDLLIFSYYFAYPGDYSTKLTVVNTSNTHSVVAKVVYRSFNWSEELLDHLIFLSPNDVWTGWLVNVNGEARLQSNDDSILGRMPSGTAYAVDEDFGNLTPVDQPLKKASCTDDSNQLGYVEIIEAASRIESKAATGYEPGMRVAKRHIYDWYAQYVTDANIVTDYPPVNVLTGYQENTFGEGATLKQANVFADYLNMRKLTIQTATFLGDNSNNTLSEVEAAMAKLNIALPYIVKPNGEYSVHIFNFPTKMSTYANLTTCAYNKANSNSPYWVTVNSKCEIYSQEIYDLSENKVTGTTTPFSPQTTIKNSMCGEVQFNVLGYSNPAFTEGWIRYGFDKSSVAKTGRDAQGLPISFTGTPVLVSVLYWNFDRANPAEANAAYEDGKVGPSVNSVTIPINPLRDKQEPWNINNYPNAYRYYQYAD